MTTVIMNRERPFINLAGQNQFQAHNNEHFDFPFGSCDVGEGLGDHPTMLDAVVE